jgi:hypothetical protein
MSRARFLAAVAAINALFALAMLLAPSQLGAFYGSALEAPALHLARIAGAVLLGLAIVQWAAREAPPSGLLNGILVAGLVASALAAVVEIHSTVNGLMTPVIGWPTAALHGMFAAGFGWLLFGKR